MSITIGLPFCIFGYKAPLPRVPDGFTLVSLDNDFLTAIRDDGSEWFVGEGENGGTVFTLYQYATQYHIDRSQGRLKLGQRFVCKDTRIEFNWDDEEKGAEL